MDSPVALASKPLVASAIAPHALRSEMVFAINLDDEAMLVDDEIDYERPKRSLTPDVDAMEPAKLAKLGPEPTLALSHISPQASRTNSRDWTAGTR